MGGFFRPRRITGIATIGAVVVIFSHIRSWVRFSPGMVGVHVSSLYVGNIDAIIDPTVPSRQVVLVGISRSCWHWRRAIVPSRIIIFVLPRSTSREATGTFFGKSFFCWFWRPISLIIFNKTFLRRGVFRVGGCSIPPRVPWIACIQTLHLQHLSM